MAVDAKAGNFAINTVTGNQIVSGLGLTPKAVIFLPTWMTADGVSAHYEQGIGFTDGTNDGTISTSDEDGQSTTDSQWSLGNDGCFELRNPGTATGGYLASIVSLAAGQWTHNIDVASGNAERVGYLALGGADLTNVFVGSFTTATSIGTKSFTVGFRPDFIMLIGTRNPGSNPNSNQNAILTVGCGTSPTERWAISVSSDHGEANSDTGRHVTSSHIYNALNANGSSYEKADLESIDVNGFTLDFTKTNATGRYFHVLALKGGQYKVGSLATQTSTGTFSSTAPGFTPVAGLFASGLTATADSEAVGLKASLGVATGTGGAQFASGGASEDAQGTSDTDNFNDDAKLYLNYDHGQTKIGDIAFSSWDANGFTLNQVDADPSANTLFYWVIGDAAVAGNTHQMFYNRRRNI